MVKEKCRSHDSYVGQSRLGSQFGKLELEPAQSLDYLGLILDMVQAKDFFASGKGPISKKSGSISEESQVSIYLSMHENSGVDGGHI